MSSFPEKQYLFKAGDKVWIQNATLSDNIEQLREPQTVESAEFVPMNADAGVYQAIFLEGLGFIYSDKDLMLDKPLDY